ncbi:hypothetical protein L6452_40269 [Arctium lappa]|uniref:Uncharacterized protein n=1 Tax=Arctium lappa TaxID=4217 RepID=A0ACB8XN74_ARCLA|nr:hypothetical protein L6452_40269 [Arctium lappa]
MLNTTRAFLGTRHYYPSEAYSLRINSDIYSSYFGAYSFGTCTYVVTNSAPISSRLSTPSLEYLARIIPNHISSNMVPTANSEASYTIVAPPLILAQPTVVSQTSGKKRNRKNKKNAQKKMRFEDQSSMHAIVLSQVPKFLAQ